jgi:AhpD family alkylhydroperoxidase
MKNIQQKARTYSIKEAYIIAYQAFLTMGKLSVARKDGLMNKQFIERIMLAVTQVNQCEVCTFAHTKIALEANMNNDEIQAMLGGEHNYAPKDELTAIMFAQHLADTKGHPSKESWEKIISVYGKEKAYGILGASRIIMMGNAFGIAYSSFLNRFKSHSKPQCSLFYEISMILASILLTPIAMIHGMIARALHVKIISF